MLTIYSPDHSLRAPATELSGGELVRPFECPERMDRILARMAEVGMTDIRPPGDHGLAPAARVHAPDYLEFLSRAWTDWVAAGFSGEAIPTSWPARRMQMRPPRNIDGALGYYAMAAESSICAGTWQAAQTAMNVALTAQGAVAEGAACAFALCRPPGHHAAHDMFGGYCFLNNAAIAAQATIDGGAGRVAVLDVDFHHGNGTQDIFYQDGDVLFVSLHGQPEDSFPYFLGYADETGMGAGEGANLNLPMPPGTSWDVWSEALEIALRRIAEFGAEFLVLSFGADTFEDDPISSFKLTSDDFSRMGERIGRLGLPTLVVMEGGYAVEALGINTVGLLQALDGTHP